MYDRTIHSILSTAQASVVLDLMRVAVARPKVITRIIRIRTTKEDDHEWIFDNNFILTNKSISKTI